MDKIYLIPTDYQSNTGSDNGKSYFPLIAKILGITTIVLVGISIYDHSVNRSWWWKRLKYETALYENEGQPRKNIIQQITGLFNNPS